ncbi:MAG TPA: aminoglycoside 6'-N-acetyltransferase [Chryseolinea sp.]|nr:aminoglycoside 6'-N-acetyltransferase [Chryseolinea sp.]
MALLRIVEVDIGNMDHWLTMAMQLWPDEDRADLARFIRESIASEKNQSLLCLTSTAECAGFIDLSLRTDYVEGCTTNPVGYLEGVFVKPEYRQNGVGAFLIREGEKWAKSKGCSEFASDTEFANADSQLFHIAMGFKHSEVIVHFWKRID